MKKIPAIRGTIGAWVYYLGALTFRDINNHVKKIDDELHKSKGLSDAIQRSITSNYLQIKKYILTQDERFFNAIVLAIYDGDPEWIEVELNLDDEEYFNLGFLSLNGEEKIFPVDGQHRVEGIKAALSERPELAEEKIAVIFIGHKKTQEGMEKTRRLFSTLNRYAKPVSMSDIVALDEDDSAAILTRHFLENIELFSGNRIVFSQQKAIPDRDKVALTSIITFYQCNVELVKYYYKRKLKHTDKYKKIIFKDFLKFRPNDSTLNGLRKFCENYWSAFAQYNKGANEYFYTETDKPAEKFRNNIDGGHILFRPIGLLPFVQATIMDSMFYEVDKISDFPFTEIMQSFNDQNYWIDKPPWRNVAWDPINKLMKTSGNQKLIKLLFLYFANLDQPDRLSEKDLDYIKNTYASFIGYEDDLSKIQLNELL